MDYLLKKKRAFKMKKILLKLILIYRKQISPYTLPACAKYIPTYSQYAYEANFKVHGALKGSYLAAKRLCGAIPFQREATTR